MDMFDAHERYVISGVVLEVKVINNGEFFLLVFDIGFCVGEPGVEGVGGFSDILHLAFFACDQVDNPIFFTVDFGGDGEGFPCDGATEFVPDIYVGANRTFLRWAFCASSFNRWM